MIEAIFNTCLFDLNDYSDVEFTEENISSIKCKTEESRKEAFVLISNLCKNEPKNIRNLIQNSLSVLIEKVKKTSNTNEKHQKQSKKSSSGYVGIKNLGNICYMNAML